MRQTAQTQSGMHISTYHQAQEFLVARINYERIHSHTYSSADFKLDRMQLLLKLLDNPQMKIPAVHVAGTKGKGSTCAYVAQILIASGYKTGLYTSPHLHRLEERFQVQGRSPNPAEFVELVAQIQPAVNEMTAQDEQLRPTFFEMTTALGWLWFQREQAEIVVLEVGMGGRLDATNVCLPVVTVITNISRDHTQILGDTITQIAGEKAGIIKTEIPVISGALHPEAQTVIREQARRLKAPLWELARDFQVQIEAISTSTNEPDRFSVTTPAGQWTQLQPALRGHHQCCNAALAVTSCALLKTAGYNISDLAIQTGLKNVIWPGRIEVLQTSPTVIVDAAHNWESAQALLETLHRDFQTTRNILIFAATRDKDVAGLLRLLVPHYDTLIFTKYQENPRGVPIEELKLNLQETSTRQAHLCEFPQSAWELATRLATPTDVITITGSFFLIAELRETILSTH